MAYIYYIKNKITNKYYVGQTARADIHERWQQHIKCMNNSKGCPILKQAFLKYGLDNFEFKVIVICFDDDRMDYEKHYIQKYNSIAPNGYNILPGGIGGAGFKGKKHKPESIARSTEGCRKYREANPDWFERCREKWKAGMAKVDTGAAVRNSAKWQKAKAEGRIGSMGRPLSEETKTKIRNSVVKYYETSPGNKPAIEKHRTAMARATGVQVEQYTRSNILVAVYPSLAEASRQTGICKSSIGNYLRNGITDKSEFIWKRRPKD